MNAEILSYSRNKGLFAGVSLEGSTLRSDGGANENLYGRKLSAKEIIRGERSAFRPAPTSWCPGWTRSRPGTSRSASHCNSIFPGIEITIEITQS